MPTGFLIGAVQSNTSPVVKSNYATNNGTTIRSTQAAKGDGEARAVASEPRPANLSVSTSANKALCYKKEDKENPYIKIAAEISNNDIKFLAKLDAENSKWEINRQSNAMLKQIIIDGKKKTVLCRGDLTGCWREQSYGFCQVYKPAHPEIISDKRFFTDARWQLETCYKLFKGGTKMYADSSDHIPLFTCP